MCFRCNAFNPFGDSNANIDLNFDTGAENEQQTNGQSAAVAAAASQVKSPIPIPKYNTRNLSARFCEINFLWGSFLKSNMLC